MTNENPSPTPEDPDPRVQIGLCLLEFSDALVNEGPETTLDHQIYSRYPDLMEELRHRFDLLRELHRRAGWPGFARSENEPEDGGERQHF